MQAHGWRAPWRWGVGVLAAIALVMLAGCGDSGSVSRSAAGVTGATSASEGTRAVDAAKKRKIGDDGDREREGDAPGRHRGRPEAEVEGQVSGKTGGCPTITFQVAGVGIKATGVTEYEGTTCSSLQDNDFVKVEGQPLGNGMILAREVKKITPPPSAEHHHAAGVTVRLVNADGVAAEMTTGDDGKFGFKNTAPGVYDLKVTLPGGTTCSAPLADVEVVARKNQVKGQLEVAGSGDATCTNLVLEKLEVKNGRG